MVTGLAAFLLTAFGVAGRLWCKLREARHHGDIAWGMVTDQDQTITRLRNERDESKREAERLRSDRDVLSLEVGNLAKRVRETEDARDANGAKLEAICRVLEG